MAPKIRAKQMWSKTHPSTQKRGIDLWKQITTWLLPFAMTTPDQTTFYVKAGNKEYGLAGISINENGTSTGISEIGLKKKYRYKTTFFY